MMMPCSGPGDEPASAGAMNLPAQGAVQPRHMAGEVCMCVCVCVCFVCVCVFCTDTYIHTYTHINMHIHAYLQHGVDADMSQKFMDRALGEAQRFRRETGKM